ncbi:MAG: hypothetical protein SGJ00_11455, partial [bacterium]|nr:hypothetical protein [bacterium]
MEKFKESNYYYSNGELYSKTKKILKIIGKENRLKVLLNGVVYNIPITDIEKIYNSSLSLKDYYQKKKGSTRTVFLPSDIYTKLKDNNILNPSSTLLIHKILTSDNISTSYLPKRFRSAKPIEISSKYKRMIGFNDTKGIQLLENMNIIQKIPYETIYLKKTQEVNFIRNHSIRYVAITNSTKFFPFKFEFTYEKAFAQKPYDKKRSEAYYRLFDYTNKEELIKYYHTIKNEFKQQINTKNSYIVIRKIASIKALINSIMEDKNYCFRNKTNGREEKLLNLIENKKNKCRNLFTTIGNLTSKDITCSQLRFLYIFLFNPDSSLFSTTSTFYKEQVKINRKSLNEEIILLKNNLSQPDFWKILMHKHAVKDKELLKT